MLWPSCLYKHIFTMFIFCTKEYEELLNSSFIDRKLFKALTIVFVFIQFSSIIALKTFDNLSTYCYPKYLRLRRALAHFDINPIKLETHQQIMSSSTICLFLFGKFNINNTKQTNKQQNKNKNKASKQTKIG